ncbi:MAG: hypothetical protein R2754_14080 [Microthrixaceae bacterium]
MRTSLGGPVIKAVGVRVALFAALIAVGMAGCGLADGGAVKTAQTAPGGAFRTENGAGWFDWVLSEGHLVYFGRLTPHTETGRPEAVLRVVTVDDDVTVPLKGGPLADAIAAAPSDTGSVMVGFAPCTKIGSIGDSASDKTCIDHGSFQLLDYQLADGKVEEIPVPGPLAKILHSSNRTQFERVLGSRLFLTTFRGDNVDAWVFDTATGDISSTKVEIYPSFDNHTTCVDDSGRRFDLLGRGVNLDPGLLPEGAKPTWDLRTESPNGRAEVTALPADALKPEYREAYWSLGCVGAGAVVSVGGDFGAAVRDEIDSRDPEVGEMVVDVPEEPVAPRVVLSAEDLQPMQVAAPGSLGTFQGEGAVFSDGRSAAALDKSGKLRPLPWMPPGSSSLVGNTLVVSPATRSTPNTQVLIDLDRYDEVAARNLREDLYG